jgi:hypothetical protein
MDSRPENALAGTMMAIVVVAVIITIWISIKAFELVVRAVCLEPSNKILWSAIGNTLVWGVVLMLDGGRTSLVAIIAGTSLLALLAIAKVVEIRNDVLLQQGFTRDDVIHEVLHEPWWQAA